jgi:hypothetical protein
MIPAEGVGTADPIHPRCQHRVVVSKGASSTRQGCEGAAKGSLESLDRGGVDNGFTGGC